MGPKTLVGLLCIMNMVCGVAVGVGVDQVAFCQPEARSGPPWRGKRGGHFERMAKRLDLDAEQHEKVKAIFEARRAQFHEAFEQVRPKLDALRAEADAELEKVLRADQMEKLAELRRKREQRRASWRARKRGERGERTPKGDKPREKKDKP